MYNLIHANAFTNNDTGSCDALDKRSIMLFDKYHQRAVYKKMLTMIPGLPMSKPMISLHDMVESYNTTNRHFAGTMSINVHSIHGSVDRTGDFDYDFAPLRASDKTRWCRVATAILCGRELPAIELIQVGEHYFVKDGHHRISVARALGIVYLDATLDVWK